MITPLFARLVVRPGRLTLSWEEGTVDIELSMGASIVSDEVVWTPAEFYREEASDAEIGGLLFLRRPQREDGSTPAATLQIASGDWVESLELEEVPALPAPVLSAPTESGKEFPANSLRASLRASAESALEVSYLEYRYAASVEQLDAAEVGKASAGSTGTEMMGTVEILQPPTSERVQELWVQARFVTVYGTPESGPFLRVGAWSEPTSAAMTPVQSFDIGDAQVGTNESVYRPESIGSRAIKPVLTLGSAGGLRAVSTGNSGQRAVLDADGFRLVGADNSSLVNFPVTGPPRVRDTVVDASSLTSLGSTTLGGVVSAVADTTITLDTATVPDPTLAPQVEERYAANYSWSDAENHWSLFFDGAYYWSVAYGSVPDQVRRYTLTGGVLTWDGVTAWVPAGWYLHSVVKVGSALFAAADNGTSYRILSVTAPSGATVTGTGGSAVSSNVWEPALATDGSRLFLIDVPVKDAENTALRATMYVPSGTSLGNSKGSISLPLDGGVNPYTSTEVALTAAMLSTSSPATLWVSISDATEEQVHKWRLTYTSTALTASTSPFDAVNNAAGYSATATSVVVDNGSYFQAGDLVQVISSGEVFRVVSVSSNTLTVARGVGGTTAATLADNEPLRVMPADSRWSLGSSNTGTSYGTLAASGGKVSGGAPYGIAKTAGADYVLLYGSDAAVLTGWRDSFGLRSGSPNLLLAYLWANATTGRTALSPTTESYKTYGTNLVVWLPSAPSGVTRAFVYGDDQSESGFHEQGSASISSGAFVMTAYSDTAAAEPTPVAFAGGASASIASAAAGWAFHGDGTYSLPQPPVGTVVSPTDGANAVQTISVSSLSSADSYVLAWDGGVSATITQPNHNLSRTVVGSVRYALDALLGSGNWRTTLPAGGVPSVNVSYEVRFVGDYSGEAVAPITAPTQTGCVVTVAQTTTGSPASSVTYDLDASRTWVHTTPTVTPLDVDLVGAATDRATEVTIVAPQPGHLGAITVNGSPATRYLSLAPRHPAALLTSAWRAYPYGDAASAQTWTVTVDGFGSGDSYVLRHDRRTFLGTSTVSASITRAGHNASRGTSGSARAGLDSLFSAATWTTTLPLSTANPDATLSYDVTLTGYLSQYENTDWGTLAVSSATGCVVTVEEKSRGVPSLSAVWRMLVVPSGGGWSVYVSEEQAR